MTSCSGTAARSIADGRATTCRNRRCVRSSRTFEPTASAPSRSARETRACCSVPWTSLTLWAFADASWWAIRSRRASTPSTFAAYDRVSTSATRWTGAAPRRWHRTSPTRAPPDATVSKPCVRSLKNSSYAAYWIGTTSAIRRTSCCATCHTISSSSLSSPAPPNCGTSRRSTTGTRTWKSRSCTACWLGCICGRVARTELRPTATSTCRNIRRRRTSTSTSGTVTSAPFREGMRSSIISPPTRLGGAAFRRCSGRAQRRVYDLRYLETLAQLQRQAQRGGAAASAARDVEAAVSAGLARISLRDIEIISTEDVRPYPDLQAEDLEGFRELVSRGAVEIQRLL